METLLNLTYRAFNSGRTPEQSRQRKKELQYAAEKARVIEQRPSPLPPSRKNLSQTSLILHPQPSCPLFTTLPPEIRQRIYDYVLGGGIIHLTHISKSMKCTYLDSTERQINDEEPPTGKFPLQMPANLDWEDERNRIPKGGQFSSLSISLLQTCHAIYAEATPILYKSNNFSMASPLVLRYLKDYTLRPQRLAEIRHLQLVPWVYFDDPELHLKRGHEPYDKETWLNFWAIVAEMDLMSLGLLVEYWGKEEDCTLDADWIQPLLKVKGLKSVGIQLQFRASAWDTRRLRSLEEEIERVWTSSD